MLNRHYEQELSHLRELAAEFSRANPALAPMLGGQSPDPDVERLLEGVAFLTGMVRQKLEDEFPEFIQNLAQLLFPHYLRPLPAATLVAFRPKAALNEAVEVLPGVMLASMPVDGTACRFRTCSRVVVEPLRLLDAQLLTEPGGSGPCLRLSFEMQGTELSQWRGDRLRLFLAANFSEASRLLRLLLRHVRAVSVHAPGGVSYTLPRDAVRPAGFDPDEGLLPYPGNAFPGFRLLQEYFLLPEKFLFVDVHGLSGWTTRGGGSRFHLDFQLSALPGWMPEVRADSFLLNVAPAVNLFGFDADPILLDHRRSEYRIRPSSSQQGHQQVYAVERVVGLRQGMAGERAYHPFGLFHSMADEDAMAYQISTRASTTRREPDVMLALAYPGDTLPQEETLSIRLTCSNGPLPERMRLGDLSEATDNSPERLAFSNIRPATPYRQPPMGEALLWRVLSHLSLNYLSVATADNLKSLLALYLFSDRQDGGGDQANRKRIDSITSVDVTPGNRLVRGVMMRGRHIRVRCVGDHFAGPGDVFLFGCVLEQFLAGYASMNAYTRFELEDLTTGETLQWAERIGLQPLI